MIGNKNKMIALQKMNFIDNISVSDSLQYLQQLPDECIDCCVTSPPYYGLRDYGATGQIGLEGTPDEYIAILVKVFHEVRRVLKPAGTLWVNIGDSYAGSGKGVWKNKMAQKEVYIPDPGSATAKQPKTWPGIKPKDLIGIPWMLAFALRADGWYLRQDLIWSKSNPMPESVTDRCTKSHEYIFLLSKSAKYFYDADAIKQPAKPSTLARVSRDVEHQTGSAHAQTNGRIKAVIGGRKRQRANEFLDPSDPMYRLNSAREYEYTDRVNKRSVWEVSTKPFKEAHFAVFPENLIVPCILAGCPEGEGIVLDPFMGSGTTALVACKLHRHFAGCDLNPDYVAMAMKRTSNEQLQQKRF